MLPVHPLAAFSTVVSAAQTVGSAIQQSAARLTGEGTFADVLSGQGDGVDLPPRPADERQAELTAEIHRELASLGIPANSMPPLRVSPSARLEVVGDHPRAAEIEGVLNENTILRERASGLEFSDPSGIVLTPGETNTNMIAR